MSIRIKQGDKWAEVKVPIYTDTTLTQKGQAADAQKVGELLTSTNERVDQVVDWMQDSDSALDDMQKVIDELPVKVSTDGFTDVLNTRLPLDISVKETTGYLDGSSDVEIAMALSGSKKLRAIISFDKYNRPTSLSSGKLLCPVTWTEVKVPSVDTGDEEKEITTYIIQNGVINKKDFGSYSVIATGGYGLVTPYVGRPSGQNYLEFSGGDKMEVGSMNFGNYNTMAFEFSTPFDLTNYHTLVIEVNQMAYVPTYLRIRDAGSDTYSDTLVLDSGTAKNYEINKEISIKGKKIIRIEGRSENADGTNKVRITNMYLIGKMESLSPNILYMMGPSGGDTSTFGSFSGYRAVINSNSFVLRWPNGQNGDYVDNFETMTGGATPDLTHSKYVDFSEYKKMKIVASLDSGYVASCEVDFINESGKVISTKDISMGTNNFNIESIIQTHGPKLKICFRADLKQMGTNIYITEVSFSK